MPQRATWSNWGYANTIRISLDKGAHTLRLVYTDMDRNMNGTVNSAAVDRIEIIRL